MKPEQLKNNFISVKEIAPGVVRIPKEAVSYTTQDVVAVGGETYKGVRIPIWAVCLRTKDNKILAGNKKYSINRLEW